MLVEPPLWSAIARPRRSLRKTLLLWNRLLHPKRRPTKRSCPLASSSLHSTPVPAGEDDDHDDSQDRRSQHEREAYDDVLIVC